MGLSVTAKSHNPGRLWLDEELKALLGAGDFRETSSLAAETAEIEELGAANFVRPDLLYLIDNFGVIGKDALYTLPEAHLADGEGALGSLAARDDHSFEGLKTLFLAFSNLYLNSDSVARGELR
jgi:hypothetical protein